jgi:hypothetical protein
MRLPKPPHVNGSEISSIYSFENYLLGFGAAWRKPTLLRNLIGPSQQTVFEAVALSKALHRQYSAMNVTVPSEGKVASTLRIRLSVSSCVYRKPRLGRNGDEVHQG